MIVPSCWSWSVLITSRRGGGRFRRGRCDSGEFLVAGIGDHGDQQTGDQPGHDTGGEEHGKAGGQA